MVLDATLLNTQHDHVKWSNPGNRVASSPKPLCSDSLGIIYIYIVSAASLFVSRESASDSSGQVYILAKPITSVTNEWTVFSFDIPRVNFSNCSRPTYFITELIRVTYGLPQEDFCKMILWLRSCDLEWLSSPASDKQSLLCRYYKQVQAIK